MVSKDRFLVVVSVLEGRKFPKRPRHKIIAEARFDGELLATDPVDHVETPDFTQELAWELDKKGLHQHRMQRTSIKVQCYAVDVQSTMKEPIGYVVLDLRSAQNVQTNKWHTLLHTKYQRNKPEIRLSIYIDEDNGPKEQGSFHAREAPVRPGVMPAEGAKTADGEVDPKTLKPMLNEAEGFYQIGPEHKCTEQFMMSVTVAFAANLPQLIPTNMPLPPNASGYFFYYSLLGNDVTNEVFHDLLNPNFPAERASVRLRSNVEALRQFFLHQPGIEMHLCCGDQSLGSADVALKGLLKKDSTEIYMKPVTIEGAFQLNPPNRMKQQLPPVPEDMKPVVGVSIVLRREEQGPAGTPIKDTEKAATTDEPPPQAPPKAPTSKKAESKTKGTPPEKLDRKPKSPPRLPSPPPPHEGSYTETFDSGSRTASKTDENVSSLKEEVKNGAKETKEVPKDKKSKKIKKSPGDKKPTESPIQPIPPSPSGPVLASAGAGAPKPQVIPVEMTSSSATGQHVVIPAQAQHFCFSVDLRSISNIQTETLINVFLRYSYPFFGSAAPILTHPPVEVRKGMEVLLPQSFCAFDFATTHQQLADTFLRVPLVVEVWDRDKQKSQNKLVGSVQLPLQQILAAEKTRAVHANGTSGWRQVYSDNLPVISTDVPDQRLGQVHVVLSLEDWGPVNLQQLVPGSDSSQGYSASDAATARQPVQQVAAPAEPRETLEYKAALELEMWKEAQESMFENQLKAKEMQHMKVLAEEWKQRDKEREILVKKKLGEYQKMEEKLQKTIADLDKRDRQLAANEQEVMRLRADLQREHERKLLEMREASRRMQEDCNHQVALERAKVKEMEEYIQKVKQQLSEAEVKQQGTEREFTAFKEQQNSKPEVRLQSEINLLTLEKAELERKLDSQTKSKVHYKQQWGRALKELARLKQKEQNLAKASLRRQQQELEHMRLRYLAAEEKEVVKSERKELEEIKNELNKLKEQESFKSQATSSMVSNPGNPTGGMQPLQPDPDAADDDHITRLIEERDTLLRTGVYSSEDRIIAELDRQIREAIANKGR